MTGVGSPEAWMAGLPPAARSAFRWVDNHTYEGPTLSRREGSSESCSEAPAQAWSRRVSVLCRCNASHSELCAGARQGRRHGCGGGGTDPSLGAGASAGGGVGSLCPGTCSGGEGAGGRREVYWAAGVSGGAVAGKDVPELGPHHHLSRLGCELLRCGSNAWLSRS